MIYVVGLGPGGAETITPQAMNVLQSCDVIAGY
ncbi:MAG: precorrin-3B C(17)-methyltransferase, partial [Synergistaceae bacterium]|nr:precorrin-3B C(17)-methyltransferase [Synergistaceae bacterium]